MKVARRPAVLAGVLLAIAIAIPAGFLALTAPRKPPALYSVTDPFARMDDSGLPGLERYRASDGAELSYRVYPTSGTQAAVLIHGSAGSSRDMHLLAMALQRSGVSVFVPDLRGHGANYPHGDLAYDGQLDDDMRGFVAVIQQQLPGRTWCLAGFSSGGGFALRIAGTDMATQFDHLILLSPFLRYDAPTVRPASKGGGGSDWYTISLPRIVALTILNSFGVHAFNRLTVIRFPVPDNIESTTASYSFRMLQNFAPHDDFRADIRKAPTATQVLVGSNDELFLPDKFAGVFQSVRPDAEVTIVPGMGHADMITDPVAIKAVVQAITRQ